MDPSTLLTGTLCNVDGVFNTFFVFNSDCFNLDIAALFTASFFFKAVIFLEGDGDFENKFRLIDFLEVSGWRFGEEELSTCGDAFDIQNIDDGVVTVGDWRLLKDSNGGGEINKLHEVDGWYFLGVVA